MKDKNYITPGGYERLRAEQRRLRYAERPKVVDEVARAAAMGDRSENAEYIYGKKRLREIDRRLRWLDQRLDAAEVVDPGVDRGERVFFGATVVLGYPDGRERTVQLVGVDEIATEQGRISWRSPLGRALMRRQEGELVAFQSPGGAVELEILEVRYEPEDLGPEAA